MQAHVTRADRLPVLARGFTLIELMIVVAIVAILITVGAPALAEFVADQRVRTTASAIAAEIAFARAKAIESSRLAFIERTGAVWKNGWRIYVDLDKSWPRTPVSSGYTVGEELQQFDGFPPTGTMYVCSTVADFALNVIFRPDGRVWRTAAAAAADGMYVVDTMGGGPVAKNKIRGLLFGVSGRVTVVKMNGVVAPC